MGQISRFLVVGLGNFGLSYLVYLVLLEPLGHRIAFAVAFVVALVFQAVMNARAVFRVSATRSRMVRYGAYYLGYFAVNSSVVNVLVEAVQVPAEWAPLLALVLVTPLNFICTRWILTR